MIGIVNTIPTILLGAIIIGGAILIASAAVVFVRRAFPNLQESGHEVIYMELVGVVYAVLLVFVLIAVWEQYEEARKTSEEEGAMLDSMWHIGLAYPDEYSLPIVAAIAEYAQAVSEDEWETLAIGEDSPVASAALADLRAAHFRVDLPSTTRFTNLYFQSIDVLESVTEHRLLRFIQSRTAVPGAVWTVLVIGALVLVGLSVLVQEKSLGLHVSMTAGLAAIIGATLFVVLILDYPWAGDAALQPEAFEHIHVMQARMHPELQGL